MLSEIPFTCLGGGSHGREHAPRCEKKSDGMVRDIGRSRSDVGYVNSSLRRGGEVDCIHPGAVAEDPDALLQLVDVGGGQAVDAAHDGDIGGGELAVPICSVDRDHNLHADGCESRSFDVVAPVMDPGDWVEEEDAR